MTPARLFELSLVCTPEGLQELAAEWRELYAESNPRNPFLSPEWAEVCHAYACPPAALFLIAARRQGRLVGVAPLRWELFRGFRLLRFLGSGWSEYAGFLCHPEEPGAEVALLHGLLQCKDDWDLLLLRQLAMEFTRLPVTQLPGGLSVQTLPGEGSPYLAYSGDWEALRAAGPRWLTNVQKRVRRWQREGGTVERYRGTEAAARVAEVARVEARSWQARHGQPIFQEEQVRRLFRDAFQLLEPRGEMELWLARMGDEPAAYEINLLTPERLWLYRGGYDEAYARLGPGSVLEYHSIRTAWDEGRREYDYMSGREPYKAERTNAVRPQQVMSFHPDTLRGHLAFALLVAPRWGLRRVPAAKPLLDYISLVRRCPQALLPWNRVLRDRVY